MSIDFATVRYLEIPEFAVMQVEDAKGVLWMLASNEPTVLEVEKVTMDTYAGETTFSGEEFILLNIYPKTNGTVSVTYGGLTKTITDTSGAEDPNAIEVFFGTLYGVSDDVATPPSGELIIEGDCAAFSIGSVTPDAKIRLPVNGCRIVAVKDFGSVTRIPSYAFSGTYSANDAIETLTVPSTVGEIMYSACASCDKLRSVTMLPGVQKIGFSAFSGCDLLNHVSIPRTVTSIGETGGSSPFPDCPSLTTINVDVENEHYCFDGHSLLNKSKTTLVAFAAASLSGRYDVPASVTFIGASAFHSCTGLKHITIPAGVTSIKQTTFYGCTGLISMTLPDGVKSIGSSAFYGCTGLTSITMPYGMTSIGSSAFSGCTALEHMVIPAGVKSIGSYAFNNCSALTSIVIRPTTPPTGASGMFDGSTCPITVPNGCGEAYRTAEYWSDYASRIMEAS